MFLDIHLEYCDDKGERLKKLADFGAPFNLSLVPILLMPEHRVFKNGVYPSDYYYPLQIVDMLKDLAKNNSNITFGQQGFAHYCIDCHEKFIKNGGRKKGAWPDPWHENKCLYGKTKSVDEQAEFMQRGKNVIENILGVSPVIYVAPNHQKDRNTNIAAEQLNYKYLADRAILNVPPYKEGNLIIIPEREELGKKGEIFYTHYDRMKENFWDYINILDESFSPDKITLSEKSKFKTNLNYQLLIKRKQLRDIIKRIR